MRADAQIKPCPKLSQVKVQKRILVVACINSSRLKFITDTFKKLLTSAKFKKKVFTNKNSQNNVSVQLSGGRFDDAVSEHFRVAQMVQLDVL